MRYFFDTEFIEDGKTIDLLSIGIISEDGRTLYLENREADLSKANEWVRINVLPKMHKGGNHSRKAIKEEILKFIGDDTKPIFWAYYADYDWVVFCQLFGTMMDLPKHFPMYCRDLKQLIDSVGNPKVLKQKDQQHNALYDAVWVRDTYDLLKEQML